LLAIAVALSPQMASALQAPAWPDHYVARLQALAQIQTLNAQILASRSATLALESWCRDHQLADPARISAHLLKADRKEPDAEQLARLGVQSASEVNYRRVELRCGDRVLSKADNWYVPARLTAEMNQLLETTDTPFGKVVAPLQPFRQTLSAQTLWSPLPADLGCSVSDADATQSLQIPAELFQHRALLFTAEHQPFSEVSEIYQNELLAFPYQSCANCALPSP
jgi:hypothetical protein